VAGRDEHLVLSQVAHGSDAHGASVALRREVLRKPLGLDFTDEELEEERSDYHLICQEDGELVGCLVLAPQSRDEVRMRQVAVSPETRGRGIGRALTEFAEDFARRQGFARMTLHARTTAVRFYEKLGYERVGEEFEEVTIPHWTMQKRL
jgi:ribosomal protein S18 acetylase RimI-like enzyme